MKSGKGHHPISRTALLFLLLWLPISTAFGQGSLGGIAWLDQNQNGLRENNERGFSGITAILMMRTGDSQFTRIGEYVTETTGLYIFIVPAGQYYVQFALPDGYQFSTPHVGLSDDLDSDVENVNGSTAVFTLANGSNLAHVDAGYIQTGGADLFLRKQVTSHQAIIGQEYTYLINVINNGPDPAINVAVQNHLSQVVELLQAYPEPEDRAAQPLRWFIPTLAVGETWSVELTVRPLTGGVDDSRCCISTTSNDPDPSNNCDGAPINVDLPVELSSFEAHSVGGAVKLVWVTESETENAGFFLLRSTDEQGPYERINEELIDGSGTTPTRKKYEYTDKNVLQNQTYFYKLADVNYQGQMEYHGPVSVLVTRPQEFQLLQNYPNPFNSETRIPFVLAEDGFVRLEIYNLLGQRVRTLVASEMTAGPQSVVWDGLNEQGLSLTTGAYLFVLQAGEQRQTRKMHLVR